MNKNTYYIPIDISDINIIKIEATSQIEAIKLIEDAIVSSKIGERHDSVRILKEEITCDEDEKMIDEIIKDFSLKVEDNKYTMCYYKDKDGDIKYETISHSIENIDA